jgi:hypothetical protein
MIIMANKSRYFSFLYQPYLESTVLYGTQQLQSMMAPDLHARRNAKDLNESLLTMLTCRSCALYLSPPVCHSWKGHSFCTCCVSSCLKCPICNTKFIKTCNVSLEIITNKYLFPCKNRTVGCNAKLKLQEIYQHEDICPR